MKCLSQIILTSFWSVVITLSIVFMGQPTVVIVNENFECQRVEVSSFDCENLPPRHKIIVELGD